MLCSKLRIDTVIAHRAVRYGVARRSSRAPGRLCRRCSWHQVPLKPRAVAALQRLRPHAIFLRVNDDTVRVGQALPPRLCVHN